MSEGGGKDEVVTVAVTAVTAVGGACRLRNLSTFFNSEMSMPPPPPPLRAPLRVSLGFETVEGFCDDVASGGAASSGRDDGLEVWSCGAGIDLVVLVFGRLRRPPGMRGRELWRCILSRSSVHDSAA